MAEGASGEGAIDSMVTVETWLSVVPGCGRCGGSMSDGSASDCSG